MHSLLHANIASDRQLYLTFVQRSLDRFQEFQAGHEGATDFEPELWLTHVAHRELLARQISTVYGAAELYELVRSLWSILGAQSSLFDLSILIEQLIWNDTIRDFQSLVTWKKALAWLAFPPLQLTEGTYGRLVNRMTASDLEAHVTSEFPRSVQLEILNRGLQRGLFKADVGNLVSLLWFLLDGARQGTNLDLEDSKALEMTVAHILATNWETATSLLTSSAEGTEVLRRLKLRGIEGLVRRLFVVGDASSPPQAPSREFLSVVASTSCEGQMMIRHLSLTKFFG